MNRLEGDWNIVGRLTCGSMVAPANSVANNAIAGTEQITATKLQHQHRAVWAQPNTTATSETRVIHVARYAGTLIDFVAGSIAACAGAATITIDLKKNGTTVLSAVITLDSGNSARVVEAGTVTVAPYAAGDVFEIVTVATAGGGTIGTGLFCAATFNEGSQ